MKRIGRRGKWLGYILSALWLFSMGLFGFFIPYFTDNLDFFKVKALHIEGLETIPPEVVVDEVRKFKNNWLFINTTTLLKNLNTKTGNSINSVRIDRVFTNRGVELNIYIQERKPFIAIVKDDTMYFLDKNGTLFQSPYIKTTKPIAYTYDIEFVKKNFTNLKMLIDSIGNDLTEVYITNISTIAYTSGGLRINMPPLFLLDHQTVENLIKVFKAYNIDMRIKELDLNMEGLVIMKGEKQK